MLSVGRDGLRLSACRFCVRKASEGSCFVEVKVFHQQHALGLHCPVHGQNVHSRCMQGQGSACDARNVHWPRLLQQMNSSPARFPVGDLWLLAFALLFYAAGTRDCKYCMRLYEVRASEDSEPCKRGPITHCAARAVFLEQLPFHDLAVAPWLGRSVCEPSPAFLLSQAAEPDALRLRLRVPRGGRPLREVPWLPVVSIPPCACSAIGPGVLLAPRDTKRKGTHSSFVSASAEVQSAYNRPWTEFAKPRWTLLMLSWQLRYVVLLKFSGQITAVASSPKLVMFDL